MRRLLYADLLRLPLRHVPLTMATRLEKARTAAIGGGLSAIGLLLLYGASLTGYGRIACLFFSALLPYVFVRQGNTRAGLLLYAATALLAWFILPDKWIACLYTALPGHYAFGRALIDRHAAQRFFSYLFKLLYCDVFLLALYFVGAALFEFDLSSYTLRLPLWLIIALSQVFLIVLEFFYQSVAVFYARRVEKRLFRA